ncbi:Na+(H+)/acetate symporter ActP [Pacificimonas flava]|nr:Na+(H+)/acetate symporter ActP [Pacificimonas flava]
MKKASNGVGIVIAGCVLSGAVIGIVLEQPSIGFLVGLAIGVAAAAALTWFSGAGGRPR